MLRTLAKTSLVALEIIGLSDITLDCLDEEGKGIEAEKCASSGNFCGFALPDPFVGDVTARIVIKCSDKCSWLHPASTWG